MEGDDNNNLDVKKMLFPDSLLRGIQWEEKRGTYLPEINPNCPGNGLCLRPLSIDDFDRGYSELLSELTDVGTVNKQIFQARFETMKSCPSTYFIVVIEDTTCDKIIGSGTLVLEQKFIHGAGKRARIEDIVVSNEYRGRQLGKLLMDTLTLLGKQLGAYKVSLECIEKLVPFYNTFGYTRDGNQYMVQRFKH